jgi:S-adenosyl methyltransferase
MAEPRPRLGHGGDTHPTTDAEPIIQAVQFWNQQGSAQMTLRTREEIVRFFDGTDLVKPTHFCGVARRNAPS